MRSLSATACKSRSKPVSSAAHGAKPMSAMRNTSRTPRSARGRRGAVIALWQRHRDVEHVVVAVLDDIDLDRVDIDADVFADHFQQLAPQQWQEVRAAAGAALLRDADAQALLGDATDDRRVGKEVVGPIQPRAS